MRQKTRSAGSGPRQLFEFGGAVEGEEPQPRLVGKRNVPFLLDRIAVGHPFGADAVCQTKFDFATARNVEIGALALKHCDDFGGRIGLDGIVDMGERQIAPQHGIGIADHIEIDDEARGFGSALGQKAGDPLVHFYGHPFGNSN